MSELIQSDIYNRELILKQKELELKEKELTLRERELELNLRIRDFELKELQRQNDFLTIQSKRNEQNETNYNIKINELLRMKQNKQYWNSDAFNDVLLEGDLQKIKWLKENLCPFGELGYYHAFLHGNIRNLDWLVANGYPLTSQLYKYAFKTGKIQMAEWLKINSCPFDDLTGKYVCELNNIDFLEFLKNSNYQFKSGLINDLFDLDIKIETFEWLKSNGQEFNDSTMCAAIHNRCKFKCSVRVLDWLIQNNCPWGILDDETQDLIIKYNKIKKTNTTMFGEFTEYEYSINKKTTILNWLLKNNCEWDFISNIKKYGEEFVIWNSTNLDNNYINSKLSESIKTNNLNFIKWYYDLKLATGKNHIINQMYQKVFHYAIHNNYWDILIWMIDNNIKPENNIIKYKKSPCAYNAQLEKAIDILKEKHIFANINKSIIESSNYENSKGQRKHNIRIKIIITLK